MERREKPKQDEAAQKLGTHLSYWGVFECLKINDEGLLVYRNPADDRERVCLPEERFEWIHCHPSAGYFSMIATQLKFRDQFYLPGSGSLIAAAITNCVNCTQKRNHVDRDQYIQHRTLENYPGAKLYVDIVGPFPKDICQGEEVSRCWMDLPSGPRQYR